MLMARSQTGCDTDCDLAGDISLLLLELENSFKMGQNKSKRPWCTMAMLKSQTGCDTDCDLAGDISSAIAHKC